MIQTRILFICHGNICRSVAAEMIMRHLTEREKCQELVISSAAVSNEEEGNDIYPPMKRALIAHGIHCLHHTARKMTAKDYDEYDLLIGMDADNIWRMQRITEGDPENKMHLLLEYVDQPDKEVSDPWYTRDFERAYNDIFRGCTGLMEWIQIHRINE